jgi:DnaJ domain
MAPLIALVVLAAFGLGIAWFLRANPSAVARRLRILLVFAGAIGVGAILVFGVRFLPSFLPELFGLGGVVLTGLIARALRYRPSRGFSTPGSSQRTETRTAFLEAWIDHGTGDVGGRVTQGRYAGRLLESLAEPELMALCGECASDPDSLRILEAYLDRRLGADWRDKMRPPSSTGGGMGRAEAFAVLGLGEGATDEEIRAAHRRLIQRVHPDVGGSADLAARINRAKDILLGV